MADLVAQVAEQGPVGLAELDPAPLALGRVGLGDVDGDQPVVVAGQHRLVRARVGEEGEDEGLAVLRSGLDSGSPKRFSA